MHSTLSRDLHLPPEIWWMVIDIVGAPSHGGASEPRSHYPTLRNCALVCQHWLRRSRWVLYRRVYLLSEAVASLFVRTLTEDSAHIGVLASLVQEVYIDGVCHPQFWNWPPGKSSFVVLLQHRLPHMHTLSLYDLNINPRYPADFLSRISQSPIRHLTLWNCPLPLINVFTIIWSLDDLHSLTLHRDTPTWYRLGSVSPSAASFAIECQELQSMQTASRAPPRCRQLRQLTLGGMYVQSKAFPPPGALGQEVTRLHLVLQATRGATSRDFGLHPMFVPTLSALQTFHVNYALTSEEAYIGNTDSLLSPPRRASYRHFISSMISSLSRVSSLRVLSFAFTLFGYFDPFTAPVRWCIARLLFYDEMQAQLRSIPSDARIYVSVEDDEPVRTRIVDYWRGILGDRLPDWRDRLHVHVRSFPRPQTTSEKLHYVGPSEADSIHAANRQLWFAYAKTNPTPPPWDRSGLCLGNDPSARAAMSEAQV
ncbi:hypothetical protein L226DRAFT_614208 [Lentinus tigrinus ALCF2SS1-7]|uniref:F-box domain-containing protein n=1 Tax=Lentinus tigrinus ALCF2SS1-6 TaxID=1328759 RepID=A0A5C2S716_9APHY|nr:hypothetical protein L227DRAFT_601674 [Lentinus tigrinus ALCF2SS1-6]RPD73306.1 hypothetical protein L226DRAFT_614208 [Lentinus tigrinus ALCF2SS1-7]